VERKRFEIKATRLLVSMPTPVDAERVLSDRTDAHMNDLASGCSYSENANHDFVARVPVNVRNIPGTAAANIPMHGDILNGCLGDSSDNLMTNSTSHCPMDVSHEIAFTLPLVPGNVMMGTGNCNCNFDMNVFLRNVENSVSKILTEK
jgi:hypothetical protein